MSDLVFVEQSHIYMVDGRKVPCVSDLCRFLSREVYKEAPPWRLELAAARGTAVHKATEQLDAHQKAAIEEEFAPYLQAYANFIQEHQPQWQLTEQSLYHSQDDYAGTIDRYGLLDAKRTLLDIKTTATVQKPLCAASLNLYRRLLEHNGYTLDQLVILHLKKDGRYKLVRFQFDDALPIALLTIHNTLKPKRRTKNG